MRNKPDTLIYFGYAITNILGREGDVKKSKQEKKKNTINLCFNEIVAA